MPHLLEQLGQPPPGPVVLGERVVVGGLGPHHARQVGTGTEGLIATSGQDHHPHGRIDLGPGQMVAQSSDDLPGHGVTSLRPVDGEGEHGAVLTDEEVVA